MSSSSWEELNNSIKELSLAEQQAIRSVLEKDLEFQQSEQNRIRSLSTSVAIKKSSLQEKRRTSSVAGSESSESGLSSPGNLSHGRTSPLPKWNNRVCSTCQCTLGYILNSGTKCKKCSSPLCEKCAHAVSSGAHSTPNAQKFHLCTICYSERELSAARNEWVQGSDEQTSEKLLQAMRGTSAEKRNSVQIPAAIPSRGKTPYKRNLTLPAIQTNFLAVPDEAPGNIQSAGGNSNFSPKFWGGSPSPRSPRSFVNSANSSISNVSATTPNDSLRALHPREPIGSPAPRPMSSTPLTGVPEDAVIPSSVERRRSAFEGSRRSGKLRRQSEAPVPTFRLSMC